MAYAVNERDFIDPVSYRIASGAVPGLGELWLDPHGHKKRAIVTGGMIDPKRYAIERGTHLYRFASQSDGAEGAMRGGWWIERSQFDHLIRYASVQQKSIGYAVRLLCCVPPEWGAALNFIIRVRAAAEVVAWRGLARTAVADFKVPTGMSNVARGTTVITAHNTNADLRVPQLFIPGTRNAGASRAMFSFEGQWQTEGAKDWLFGSGA